MQTVLQALHARQEFMETVISFLIWVAVLPSRDFGPGVFTLGSSHVLSCAQTTSADFSVKPMRGWQLLNTGFQRLFSASPNALKVVEELRSVMWRGGEEDSALFLN